MTRMALEQAYPGVDFQRRTRGWFARLTRVPPECAHLAADQRWMATYAPDTLYLRGRGSPLRVPPRPEVSLCRACLLRLLEPELAAYGGRVVAFEPDAEIFSQYFFVSRDDFEPSGMQEALAAAVNARLAASFGRCAECRRTATWLWLAQEEVSSLEDSEQVREAPGRPLCPAHGAAALCRGLAAVEEANLFYVNAPYGDSGAFLWI